MSTLLDITLKLGDMLLGWLLYLPRDLRLVMLAVLTTLLMSLVKKFVTDSAWLASARADLKQLVCLIRQARAEKDAQAVERYRYTRALIQLRQLKAEFKALVAVILPLLLVGAWSWHRMEYVPPVKNAPFEIVLQTPASYIGETVYLVPADGVTADNWLRIVERGDHIDYPGKAVWTLTSASEKEMDLLFRAGDISLEQPIIVGGKYYQSPSFTIHSGGWRTEMVMDEVKLLGKLPGIGSFPPWVMAYMLLVLLLLPLSRRFLRVG